MKRFTKIMAAALVLLMASSAFADERGLEIMTEVAAFKEPAYSLSVVNIVLKDKAGKEETWVVEEYGKSDNGLASLVMIFQGGAKKGTRFLSGTSTFRKPEPACSLMTAT